MFYDRPKKRKQIPKQEETPVKAGTEPAQEPAPPQEKKERKRFSFFRFFFLTPVHESTRYVSEEDSYAEVPAQPEKKKSRHLLLKAVSALLALMIAMLGLLYVLPVGVFGSRAKSLYAADNDLPGGYIHVLLIGADVDEYGTSRSDTMIIASVAPGEIKLTSLQRDTGVIIPGRSGYHRLNAAYAYGGPELLLKTVNTNFGLNITRYVLVDYESFPGIIDKLGGVTLSVSAAEIGEINKNLYSLLSSDWRKGKREYDAAYELYLKSKMDPALAGDSVHLNGLQALSYARIRKLDSDYGRTSRQRKVMSAALEQVKENAFNPFFVVPLAGEALSSVETNMNGMEIMSIALKALTADAPAQTRLPAPGTYTDPGSMFVDVDYKANTAYFIDFIYGE